jgi:hypothetical protein
MAYPAIIALKTAFMSLTTVLLTLELYSRLPVSVPVVPLSNEIVSTSRVHLLFHGFGGPDGNTDRIMDAFAHSNSPQEASLCYNWLSHRTNVLRAAYTGQAIGKQLGRQIALSNCCSELHCIGISVGSFAADACIKEYKRIKGKQPLKYGTRLTLLCPFTQRGLFGIGYGNRL